MENGYSHESDKVVQKLEVLSQNLREAVVDDSVEMQYVQRHASELISLAFKEKEKRLYARQRNGHRSTSEAA